MCATRIGTATPGRKSDPTLASGEINRREKHHCNSTTLRILVTLMSRLMAEQVQISRCHATLLQDRDYVPPGFSKRGHKADNIEANYIPDGHGLASPKPNAYPRTPAPVAANKPFTEHMVGSWSTKVIPACNQRQLHALKVSARLALSPSVDRQRSSCRLF